MVPFDSWEWDLLIFGRVPTFLGLDFSITFHMPAHPEKIDIFNLFFSFSSKSQRKSCSEKGLNRELAVEIYQKKLWNQNAKCGFFLDFSPSSWPLKNEFFSYISKTAWKTWSEKGLNREMGAQLYKKEALCKNAMGRFFSNFSNLCTAQSK